MNFGQFEGWLDKNKFVRFFVRTALCATKDLTSSDELAKAKGFSAFRVDLSSQRLVTQKGRPPYLAMTLTARDGPNESWGSIVFPQAKEINSFLHQPQMENYETEEVELSDETLVRGTAWADLKKEMKSKTFLKQFSTPRDR